ncbi:MAG TPA: thioesterase family protein, partial [Thermoanaerobaculia bacterium]|nr:thioesterase family protein [Thermoanaerobaculia bacterium]
MRTPSSHRFAESRLRVRYKETDQMAVAHHSNYLAWFEVGRTDLCREAGISYREIEARGYVLVVTE